MTAATAPAPTENAKLARWTAWLAGGGATATALAILAIAVWPASETEKARDDGERVGAAVTQLQTASTSAEVDDALTELRDAVHDTRVHGYEAASSQVSDQADALDRAAEGYVGSLTSDDDFEQSIYNTELDDALGDLQSQASDFRETGPEVQQAFWDGYEIGLAGEST